MTRQEWARVFELFGPSVPGAEEQARKLINRPLNEFAMANQLLRRFDALEELPKIACPTLVCVGDLDPITPVAAAREIVESMSAGTARLEVLKGAGHFPWRDVPDRYWPLMMEFVAAASRHDMKP